MELRIGDPPSTSPSTTWSCGSGTWCRRVGEVGLVGTAAAIANAVHHATGIRVRDLPITLDKLLH
ncbi:hypothetical protein [Streptomyces sp. NPDC004012]